ncbi:uncharacterized protein LOC143027983 [Oratosquilla oratoria]|uniref:uncharacterized protein LOC143027983 n=1 Tax=Oratosquilla oratoria TaxID=337810 RepID=UPI003F772C1A
MDTGEVLDDWKAANVTPIFKKDSKRLASNQSPYMPKAYAPLPPTPREGPASNYRPITLTSQISKSMVKLINDSIMNHLQQHKLIIETRHGFILVNEYLDGGSPIDVLYLDLAKVFDEAPNKRLAAKIKAYGMPKAGIPELQGRNSAAVTRQHVLVADYPREVEHGR